MFGRGKEKVKKMKKRATINKWLYSDTTVTYRGQTYTTIKNSPDINICVNKIAELVANMTIKLYKNTENGDIRLKDGLAKKIDINPCKTMTRRTFIYCLVRDLILEGNAYAIPITHNGLLIDIQIVSPSQVEQVGYKYKINGIEYEWEEILHFIYHPDVDDISKGTKLITYLYSTLASVNATHSTKINILSNKFVPPLIIKIDSFDELLTTEDGQKKLQEKYSNSVSNGMPFVVPADLVDIQTIKPLTLNDMAIADSIKLDKQDIANIIGVPPFMVGVGQFNQAEFNTFIKTTVHSITKCIEQELTLKLIYSDDRYFKFDIWSLLHYDLKELAEVGISLHKGGLMLGNEVRNWLNLEPLDGLNKLTILENYIPIEDIGNQKKLNKEKGESDES